MDEDFEIAQAKRRSDCQTVAGGFEWVDARCNKCGASWRAIPGRGPGKFVEIIGGVMLQCPECANEGETRVS